MPPPPSAPDPGAAPGVAPDVESSAAIAALREQGAQHADPAGFGFVETLARRTAAQQGTARPWLEARLAQAIKAHAQRFDAARAAAAQDLAAWALRFPAAAPGLQRLWAEGRLAALRHEAARLAAAAARRPLAELLQQLGQPQPAPGTDTGPAQPPELRALRQSRATWARLGVDRQLARSRADLPANPGPLNSQLLAQQALQMMLAVSPAYLQGFVTQIEALLWLDAADPGPAPRRAGDKKRLAAANKPARAAGRSQNKK